MCPATRLQSFEPSQQVRLLASLWRELVQVETAAARSSAREADRLGSSPPGVVLRAVAGHAHDTVAELALLRAACNLGPVGLPERLLLLVAAARGSLGVPVRAKHVGYRACLRELCDGVAIARLLRSTARVTGHLEILDFCERWLGVRVPLLDLANEELSWFAENPTRAMSRATLALARA